ncbi:MAG: penicillin-binding transpeptidase domain-containing protein, partial [Myxococcota bacterium]|nr:penicillin-binding transpeptidase domain-containing protein [Myxococcota bacterium]
MRASDREVLSLVGGADFRRSQYNRAIQARRQGGSVFKPLVYGAGIEAGVMGPETTYPNKRVAYSGGKKAWRPRNADGVHDGAETTIGDALRRSLNVIAVQALQDTGIGRLTDFCRRLGVTAPIPPDLTAALGSTEVSVMEITSTYATLANGGLAGRPVLVRRV